MIAVEEPLIVGPNQVIFIKPESMWPNCGKGVQYKLFQIHRYLDKIKGSTKTLDFFWGMFLKTAIELYWLSYFLIFFRVKFFFEVQFWSTIFGVS